MERQLKRKEKEQKQPIFVDKKNIESKEKEREDE